MAKFTTIRFSDLDNHLEQSGGEFRMGREALDSPQIGVTWIRLPAGGSTQGDKGHFHDRQDEIYIVISGGPVEFKVEDEKTRLQGGAAIRIDAGAVHALRNVGDGDALVIAVSGQQPEAGDDSHPVDGFVPEYDQDQEQESGDG
ncbi:MAG: Mannose-6-phosphate isomerase [Solirubrobacterales bacterium]|jgi:quercetin dioxygenase-like cupin family protein|nr:Mannose-6-phosphate isomerase [Solirubrobacterales bacterium]